MWARKETIQGIFSRNGDRLLAVCLSESLVSPWSPMLIRVTGWDYFGDSVGADSDLPLQIRRSSSSQGNVAQWWLNRNGNRPLNRNRNRPQGSAGLTGDPGVRRDDG